MLEKRQGKRKSSWKIWTDLFALKEGSPSFIEQREALANLVGSQVGEYVNRIRTHISLIRRWTKWEIDNRRINPYIAQLQWNKWWSTEIMAWFEQRPRFEQITKCKSSILVIVRREPRVSNSADCSGSVRRLWTGECIAPAAAAAANADRCPGRTLAPTWYNCDEGQDVNWEKRISANQTKNRNGMIKYLIDENEPTPNFKRIISSICGQLSFKCPETVWKYNSEDWGNSKKAGKMMLTNWKHPAKANKKTTI